MCKCWIIGIFFLILIGILLYRIIKKRLQRENFGEELDEDVLNECILEKKKDSCAFSEDSKTPCVIDQCDCKEGTRMKNPTLEDENIAKTTGKTLLNQCNTYCQSIYDCYYKKKKSPYANYLNF